MCSTTKKGCVPLYFEYSVYSTCLQKEKKNTKTMSRSTQVSLGMVGSPPYSWKKYFILLYFIFVLISYKSMLVQLKQNPLKLCSMIFLLP